MTGPIKKHASYFLDVRRDDIDNGSIVNAVVLDPQTFVPIQLTRRDFSLSVQALKYFPPAQIQLCWYFHHSTPAVLKRATPSTRNIVTSYRTTLPLRTQNISGDLVFVCVVRRSITYRRKTLAGLLPLAVEITSICQLTTLVDSAANEDGYTRSWYHSNVACLPVPHLRSSVEEIPRLVSSGKRFRHHNTRNLEVLMHIEVSGREILPRSTAAS